MFIDRIIDRIYILVVILTTELLNPAQIEPCCRVSWNATPFWQFKIQSSNDIHSADALVLYGSTIYSVRGILFNGIKVRQNHTAADVFLNYLRYFTLIKSSPISDIRPISEGLIKRKVFAGAHTI